MGSRGCPDRLFGWLYLLAPGGTTDSFGPDLRPVTNGLGFLPWSNCVHYDSEPQRRVAYHALSVTGPFLQGMQSTMASAFSIEVSR